MAGADADCGAALMGSGWVDFGEVKAAISLRTVLQVYGVLEKLRRSGEQHYRGSCPIHRGEGRDAFHVQLDKNAFHCFSCHAGGNVLDLVMAMEQCSLREAALRLQQQLVPSHGGARRRQLPSEENKLVTEKRTEPAPLRFSLTGLRIEHPYVSGRGLTWQTAAQFGIGYYPGPGIMRNRIVIPIHNQRGQVIAYCGRAIHGEEPRYKFPAAFQKSTALFNYHRAAPLAQDAVVVVEGFFDCMRVHQAGFPSVVALMGSALSPAQEADLAKGFRSVMLMLDGDAAGRAGSKAAAERLSTRCHVHEVALEPGQQPDQMSNEELWATLSH
jgi:DNA primase